MAINYGSNNVTTTGKVTSNAIDIVDGSNTLYFWNIGGSGDWATTSNWWLDYDHTIPADRIPNDKDIGRIRSGVTSVSSGNIVAKIIIVEGVGYLNSSTTVYSDVYFYESTYISSGKIAGNAIFYDTSYLNYGGSSSDPIITGEAIFNNSSSINPSVSSAYIGKNITFNDSSTPYNSGYIYCPKTIINSSSYAASYYGDVDVIRAIGIGSSNIVVYGDLTMYGDSYIAGNGVFVYTGKLKLKDFSYISNSSTVNFYGKSEFIIDSSYSSYVSSVSIMNSYHLTIIVNKMLTSYGWMFGGGSNNINCNTLIFNNDSYLFGSNTLNVNKLIFNDNSYVSSGSSYSQLIPIVIFNDDSFNDGTIHCDLAVFNDTSYNDGTISDAYGYGHASFNDLSSNSSGCTVNGQAVFKGWSQNYGTIDGDAWFDEFSSHNTGGFVYGSAYYLGPSANNGGTDNASYFQNWD